MAVLARMLVAVVLAACAVAVTAKSWSPGIPMPTERHFTQQRDHFGNVTGTFQQRYFTYDGAFDKSPADGAPPVIFFYTGNEGPIEEFYDASGFVFHAAPQFGALVVFAEHRFYGKSWPYAPVARNYDRDNIALLSVEQALADYATLIADLKRQLNAPDAVVISFGGSYGGMLTAWFRVKYPHVIDGALAASAPILMAQQYPAKPRFFDTIMSDFANAAWDCPPKYKMAFSVAQELAKTSKGLAELTSIFNLCAPLTTDTVEHFLLWARNAFVSLAMGDYPYPTQFLGRLPGYPVNAVCAAMMNATDTHKYPNRSLDDGLLRGLATSVELYYQGAFGADGGTTPLKCFDITTQFVECADQTGCGVGNAGHSWDYQACTEIIYFPSTRANNAMFFEYLWTPAKLKAHCQARWGIVPNLTRMRTIYHGRNISHVGNIIFSNGLLDPWHGGGVLESLSPSMPAVLIKRGAHHLDLRMPNKADPPSVRAARKTELEYIGRFIDEARQSKTN